MVVLALLACAFLALLDGTVIGTALPRIVHEVGGDDTWYLWLVTAYLITSTVSVPIYGRFGDLFGRRRLLLAGLAVFLAGSLACGAAGDIGTLVAARAVQGLGAGSLLALGMAAIRDLGAEAGSVRMQTLLGGMVVAGMVGGPILGGLLTDHAGWRWTFWVNLPIGVAALAVIAARLPADRARHGTDRRLDVAGITLLTGGLTLVLLALSLQRYWLILAAGAALLACLVPVERRAEVPILPPAVLGRRSSAALLTGGFWYQAAALPAGVFLPLYLQHDRHFSATTSAFVLLPMLIGMAAGNRLTASVVLRTGRTRPVLLTGAVLVTAAGIALLLSPAGAHPVHLAALTLVAGLGLGPAMGGHTIAVQRSVPHADMGTATAAAILTKQLGGLVGLAAAQLPALPALRAAGWSGAAGGVLAFAALLAFREAGPEPAPAGTSVDTAAAR
ncbi:MDR family MFS transporter [Dactylosporangium fulvum]